MNTNISQISHINLFSNQPKIKNVIGEFIKLEPIVEKLLRGLFLTDSMNITYRCLPCL